MNGLVGKNGTTKKVYPPPFYNLHTGELSVKINGSDHFLHITFSELFFEEQLLLLLLSII